MGRRVVAYLHVKDAALGWLQLGLLTAMASRGADYLVRYRYPESVGDKGGNWTLSIVEQAAPLWAWSLLFLIVGLTGLIAELWVRAGRNPKLNFGGDGVWVHVVWGCHTIACVLYAVFGAFSLIPVAETRWGWTAGTQLLLIALGHYVFITHRDTAKQLGL